MRNYAEVQREFVHRYMDVDGVTGVRIQEIDGEIVLAVQVVDDAPSGLPESFRGVRVVVLAGRQPVLAYS